MQLEIKENGPRKIWRKVLGDGLMLSILNMPALESVTQLRGKSVIALLPHQHHSHPSHPHNLCFITWFCNWLPPAAACAQVPLVIVCASGF